MLPPLSTVDVVHCHQKYTGCNGHAGHDCEDASEGNVFAPLPVKKINAVMQGL